MIQRDSNLRQLRNIVEVVSEIEIGRSLQGTWDLLVDIDRQPEWMRDALSVEKLTEGPVDVGTKMRVPTQILFFRTTDMMEVTTFDPPRRWAVRHVGLVTGEGEFSLEPAGGGEATRVTWREHLEVPLGIFGRVGLKVLRPVLRRQFSHDLRRFKQICER